MAEETNFKDFVHERFGHADAKADRIMDVLVGMVERFGSLEKLFAGLRVDFAHLREDLVRVDQRLDKFDERLDRIERRLELAAAPAGEPV
jgi:hypothetical protein